MPLYTLHKVFQCPTFACEKLRSVGVITGRVPFSPHACPGITPKHGEKMGHLPFLHFFAKLITILAETSSLGNMKATGTGPVTVY